MLQVGGETEGFPDDTVGQGEHQHGLGEPSCPVYSRLQAAARRPELRRVGSTTAQDAHHPAQTYRPDDAIHVRGLRTVKG